MESNRYSIRKLEELIRSYVNNPKLGAGVELSNIILEGEDLIDVLDNIGFETDKEMDEYKNAKANYDEKCEEYKKLEGKFKELTKRYENLEEEYNKNLKADIEKLVQGKEGPFIDKIKEILKK